MSAKSDRKAGTPEPSTPGRPHDSSRQQKYDDQNLESGSDSLDSGSTAKYRDRPTDDGMKGDGDTEPNAGSPHLPRQKPSRRTHTKGTG